MLDVTKIEMFKSLTEWEIENDFFDLHNDFVCLSFDLNAECREVLVKFMSINKNVQICLVFKEAQVVRFHMERRCADCNIINNIYRGRAEVNGTLIEYFEDGASYFYLEFENGDSFEIKANKLFLEFTNVDKDRLKQ